MIKLMFYVYILKWNKKHYIWYTANLKTRIDRHNQWNTLTTRKMWTLTLLGYFEKSTKSEALKLEKMIKRNGHINHRLQHETFIRA